MNDAFGHHPKLHCTYQHHEQACAMAAEAYARMDNRMAAVCVTTGPGATNAITGVLGGWMDSIPMLVFSGQARYATTVPASGLPLLSLIHILAYLCGTGDSDLLLYVHAEYLRKRRTG